MRAPAFWFTSPKRPATLAQLLGPLGQLYALATARRLRSGAGLGYAAAAPVICVGNINAGGTGKTPAVIALIERLGQGAHVVSKGYGGSLTGPVRVDPARHKASQVGDEPLLLAAFGPTWIAKDRVAGVKAAEDAGAEVIVLDDGHQDPSVRKDLSLVVVDAAVGFGNGRCLPAGPLREPVAAGLTRADLILSVGSDPAQRAFSEEWAHAIRCPHIGGELRPLPTGMPWAGMKAFAFAGIGRPDKFFETLRDLGVDLVHAEPLDDHQPFSPKLLERLEQDSRSAGAQLVTTEKDAVRLPVSFRPKVLSLPVRLTIEEDAALRTALNAIRK